MRISDWSSDVCSSDLLSPSSSSCPVSLRLSRRRAPPSGIRQKSRWRKHGSPQAADCLFAALNAYLVLQFYALCIIHNSTEITRNSPAGAPPDPPNTPVTYCSGWRSEEHTSELQSLMRISYAVF